MKTAVKVALSLALISIFISMAATEIISSSSDEDAKKLQILRGRINQTDEGIVVLLGQRTAIVKEVGEVKKRLATPIYDPGREAELAKLHREWAQKYGADEEVVKKVFGVVISGSKKQQQETR